MNLLILDEPTNHLDIDSREALESALHQFDGTIITVSHDRYFIKKLATRILDLTQSGLVDIKVTREGHGYEELCQDRERRSAQGDSAASRTENVRLSTQKEQYLKNKQAAADARRAQARLERLRKEAEKLEAELAQIEEKMNGEAATDYVLLSELDTKKNALEERLLEIYEEI